MLENPAGLNPLTEKIIGCAMTVHRTFGPGLLESIYQECLLVELRFAGLKVECEHRVPLIYRDVSVGRGFKLDLVVEGKVVVEVKAVQDLAPVHTAQMLTYLKLTGCPVGLMINFNVAVLKDGIRRVIKRETHAA
jgi:GxxExxY protein